jgi:hypothetical protein
LLMKDSLPSRGRPFRLSLVAEAREVERLDALREDFGPRTDDLAHLQKLLHGVPQHPGLMHEAIKTCRELVLEGEQRLYRFFLCHVSTLSLGDESIHLEFGKFSRIIRPGWKLKKLEAEGEQLVHHTLCVEDGRGIEHQHPALELRGYLGEQR